MVSFILLRVPGPLEIALIVVILLLLFGGRKIPELMKGLGQGLREFKKASKGETDTEKENDNEEIKTD